MNTRGRWKRDYPPTTPSSSAPRMKTHRTANWHFDAQVMSSPDSHDFSCSLFAQSTHMKHQARQTTTRTSDNCFEILGRSWSKNMAEQTLGSHVWETNSFYRTCWQKEPLGKTPLNHVTLSASVGKAVSSKWAIFFTQAAKYSPRYLTQVTATVHIRTKKFKARALAWPDHILSGNLRHFLRGHQSIREERKRSGLCTSVRAKLAVALRVWRETSANGSGHQKIAAVELKNACCYRSSNVGKPCSVSHLFCSGTIFLCCSYVNCLCCIFAQMPKDVQTSFPCSLISYFPKASTFVFLFCPHLGTRYYSPQNFAHVCSTFTSAMKFGKCSRAKR